MLVTNSIGPVAASAGARLAYTEHFTPTNGGLLDAQCTVTQLITNFIVYSSAFAVFSRLFEIKTAGRGIECCYTTLSVESEKSNLLLFRLFLIHKHSVNFFWKSFYEHLFR